MEKHKGYKFRINPNKEQRILLAKTFGCVRFIYNTMLYDKINHYKKTGQTLKVSPAQYKEENPWLAEVDSLALASAWKNLEQAYSNFFRNPQHFGFPKFKSRKFYHNRYTTHCVNNNIRLSKGFLRLPKLGKVRIKQHRSIPEDHVLKSVTVSQSPDGKYYASIKFAYKSQARKIKPQIFPGLDFSMSEFFVDSEGNKANYPKYYRQAEEQLKGEQRKLSRMVKGSNNYEKQRTKVAKAHAKVANQRKDFLHKLSRKIADTYDCVCVENLNMQAMSQCLNFGKSVHDAGWGMFVEFLKYKLEDRGKYLIEVGKFFASSQLCSSCGYKNSVTKDLSVREWTCPSCGIHHDRDKNAAINIRNEGQRLVFA